MNYGDIKQLASSQGRRIDELLALHPSNDPFYVGRKGQIAMAKWFAELWTKFGYSEGRGVHLRRVHYQLVSQREPTRHRGDPYQNTDKCWNYLCSAAKYARCLGLVDVGAFADHRNPNPYILGAETQPDEPSVTFHGEEWEIPSITLPDCKLQFPWPFIEGFEGLEYHGFHIELWVEKSTMNDVLIPLCEELGVNLVTSLGFQSITNVFNLLKRIARRGEPARIFYISDFDPAGDGMPVAVARQIEFWSRFFAGALGVELPEIKLDPICLTREQVKKWELPRIPIKDSDNRKGNFEDRMGEGAVELDALEALYPGELANLVRAKIEPFRDPELEDKLREIKLNNQQVIDEQWREECWVQIRRFEMLRSQAVEIIERYSSLTQLLNERLARHLDSIFEELGSVWLDALSKIEGFDPTILDAPQRLEPKEESFLFESGRDYLSQLESYKEHKGVAS